MSGGSFIRFFIGIVLSLTVLTSFFSGEGGSALSVILALIFILLSIAWFAFKF